MVANTAKAPGNPHTKHRIEMSGPIASSDLISALVSARNYNKPDSSLMVEVLGALAEIENNKYNIELVQHCNTHVYTNRLTVFPYINVRFQSGKVIGLNELIQQAKHSTGDPLYPICPTDDGSDWSPTHIVKTYNFVDHLVLQCNHYDIS